MVINITFTSTTIYVASQNHSFPLMLLCSTIWLAKIILSIYLQIDNNTDGLVDFREFVAATLHVHQLEEDSDKWQQLSQAAFEKFDLDKDGYITPEELRMVGLTSFVKL